MRAAACVVANKVPAILYGGHREPRAARRSITQKLLLLLDNERFYSTILNLKVGDVSQAAILKDVQRHPAQERRSCTSTCSACSRTRRSASTIPLHFKGDGAARRASRRAASSRTCATTSR